MEHETSLPGAWRPARHPGVSAEVRSCSRGAGRWTACRRDLGRRENFCVLSFSPSLGDELVLVFLRVGPTTK